MQCEIGPGRHLLGVAAVSIPAGEGGLRTQVLSAADAEAAGATGAGQPGDTDPVARAPLGHVGADGNDSAHDLMAGCDGEPPRLQVTLDELEIGPAHGAGPNLDDDLPRSGAWRRSFGPAQRPLFDRSGVFEDLALHLGS